MKGFGAAVHRARQMSYHTVPTRIRDRRLCDSLRKQSFTLKETHEYISQIISDGRPALLSRPGGVESDVLNFFLRKRLNSAHRIQRKYPKTLREKAKFNAGILHRTEGDLDFFSLMYLRGILDSDLMGFGLFARPALAWAELLKKQGVSPVFLHHLEPFEVLGSPLDPWTRALENKKVLVIHPFEESITSQYLRWQEVAGVKEIMSNFSLEVLKPPVTFAGETSSLVWPEHWESLKNAVEEREFDVAIVGAGSYGLPIAAHAKKMGKVGLHLGGITQLLFGIRGQRWESRLPLDDWGQQGWVRPLDSETPARASALEKGAYW